MRGLLWKELRDQRPTLLLAAVLMAVLPVLAYAVLSFGPVEGRNWKTVTQMLPFGYALLVWPLTAIAAAAATHAEGTVATRAFLLSRPVSRSAIWSMKAAVGLTVLGTVIAVSDLVVRGLGPLTGAQVTSFFWPDVGLADFAFLPKVLAATGPLGAAIVLYATTLLFAGWGLRPLTAALAGGIVGGLLYLANTVFWWNLDTLAQFTFYAPLTLGVLALGLGGSGWWWARRAQLGSARDAWASTLGHGVAVGVGVVAVTGALAVWTTRLPLADLVMTDLTTAGDGYAYVTGARARTLAARSVWRIDLASGQARPALPRQTASATAAPDGSSIAHVSTRGWMGMRTQMARLVLSGDPIAPVPEVPIDQALHRGWGLPVYRHDSQAVAIVARRSIYAVDLGSREAWRYPMTNPTCAFLGWNTDGRIVRACGGAALQIRWDRPGESPLNTQLTLAAGGWVLPNRNALADAGPVQWGAFARRTSAGQLLHIVDLATGESRPLGKPAVRVDTTQATRSGHVAYALHAGGVEQSHPVSIFVGDVASGESVLLATLSARATQLGFGPNGDWLVVQAFQENELEAFALRRSDGARRDLELPLRSDQVAWANPTTLLIPHDIVEGERLDRGWFQSVQVVDLETGDARLIRPRPQR